MSDTSRPSATAERLRSDLSALGAAGAAALLVAADGRRVVWATPAGADLVGAVPAAQLAGTDLHPDRLPVDRFAELAAGAAPLQGQRLERLRVLNGRRVETVTFSVRRVLLDGQDPLLLLVVPGPRRLPRAGAEPAPFPALLDPPAPPLAAELPADAAPVGSSQPTVESLRAAAGGRPLLRFVWQTDGEGRFVAPAPALEKLVGPAWAIRAGETWGDVFARGVQDDGLVGAALDAATTFTNIDVSWPVGDGSQSVPVALSGVPDPMRQGVSPGMRGFGLVRIEGLSARALDAVAPEADIETEEAAEPVEPDHPVEAPAQDPSPDEAQDVPPVANAVVADADDAVMTDGPEVEGSAGETAAADPVQETPEDKPHASAEAAVPTEPVAVTPVEAQEEDTADAAPEIDVEWREPEAPADQPERPAASIEPRPPETSVVPFSQVRGAVRATLADSKVVPIRAGTGVRADMPDDGRSGLSRSERHAFREIARALGARLEGDLEAPAQPVPMLSEAPVRTSEATPAEPTPADEATDGGEVSSTDGATPVPVDRVEPAAPAHLTAPEQQGAEHDDTAAVAAAEAEPGLSDLARHADAIFDRLPVGVLVSRGDVPITMNRTLLDLLGWEDMDSFHREGGMQRLFRGRGTPTLIGAEGGTVALSTRDGDIIGVDARLQTVPWDDLPATLMTFRRAVDVEFGPKLKATELDLRRREGEVRELRAMLDTATDGVIVLDEAGRILSINRSGEALFGYDQNEVAGETFISLFAPDSHATALDYLEGLKSNGVASVLNDGREVVGRVRQGGRIPLFMTLGAISDPPERKFCAVLRDITPWKKAEADLLEAKRAAEEASAQKSDFLAKMSHEIRTPLSAIIGFAEVMMEERFGPVGNERYLEYLRDIHASGGHVISLVNDLLDLSKIEAGRFDLAFVSVDVNESVARSVALIQPQAGSGRVVVRTALAQRLPRVVADERSLRQIVLNLLSNAVKFTDPGGQVIVSTAMTDRGEVAIRVRDTGIGMTEKEIETALEPFRQVATARRAGGTGLGLPLTKALVEANRAALTIRSARDSGTLVEVLFPTTRVLAE
ncbi:ATP-binding protein [uncultured Alsobacter sp.]|uniref:PAS domain-containing sensor histidine kinase n=1 Tax=uncultured Alsobacter sp. TaxID=1748258 RepID=UPI0025D5E5F5|nr:ATP-binding protein [uncultured Alsobacter sp.]